MLQMCGTTNPVQVHKEFQVPEVMEISWCLDGIYGIYVQHVSHSNIRPSNSPCVDTTLLLGPSHNRSYAIDAKSKFSMRQHATMWQWMNWSNFENKKSFYWQHQSHHYANHSGMCFLYAIGVTRKTFLDNLFLAKSCDNKTRWPLEWYHLVPHRSCLREVVQFIWNSRCNWTWLLMKHLYAIFPRAPVQQMSSKCATSTSAISVPFHTRQLSNGGQDATRHQNQCLYHDDETFIISVDFYQTLPIFPLGTSANELKNWVMSSSLWISLKQQMLSNMGTPAGWS